MEKFFLIAVILACFSFSGGIRTNPVCAQDLSGGTSGEIMAKAGHQVKIRLSFGKNEAMIAMDNNPASQDLLSMLPLTLTFKDYNGTEKISYLPRKLNTHGSPTSCKPSVGTFAYYIPWGNLAIFYHDFRQSNGLAPLGQVISGMQKLAEMRDNFSVRVEKAE